MSRFDERDHAEEGLLCGISGHLPTLAYSSGIPFAEYRRYPLGMLLQIEGRTLHTEPCPKLSQTGHNRPKQSNSLRLVASIGWDRQGELK